MQGTPVCSLILEDPTCCKAIKPVYHNYWADMLQLLKPTCPSSCSLQQEKRRNEKPAHRKEYPHSLQLEKACAQQWRPSTVRNKS